MDKERGEILPVSTVKHYDVRKAPTFFAIGVVVLGWFLNEVSLAWIHERVPRDTPPLPDLFFSIFPEVQGSIRVTEYIMLILVVNALVVIIGHQHRWIVARRVLFCAGLSYCFRALCITVFQVPVPSVNTYCAPKTTGGFDVVSARVARMFWSAGIEQLRPRELCGDLIVSGHTLTIFTCLFAFKHYAPRKLQIVGHLYHLLAFCAIIAILLARKHYTIDVILGYTVSSRVFMEYHSLASSFHDDAFERNALSGSFWSPVVKYFERDAPPPQLFHNHVEWPSSCPSKIRRRLAN